MYEICRLLAPKKTAKVRKPSKPAIHIGAEMTLTINGKKVIVAEKDNRCKSAYFVTDLDGNRLPYSFARDCLV